MIQSILQRMLIGIMLALVVSSIAAGSGELVIIGVNTNRVQTGEIEIPVDVRIADTNKLTGVHVLIDDGEGFARADESSPLRASRLVARWDTTEVSNGWHTLQAFAEYPDAAMEGAGGYSTYSSQVVRVQTFNPITFPNMLMTYGSSLVIRAHAAATNASWKATVSTLSNQVLRVLTGTTTNGTIETPWDGKDANGVRVNPEAVHIEVETVSTSDDERH